MHGVHFTVDSVGGAVPPPESQGWKDTVLLEDGEAVDVLLAEVRGRVRDRLRKASVMADIGENRIYQSVPAAVHDFEQRNR